MLCFFLLSKFSTNYILTKLTNKTIIYIYMYMYVYVYTHNTNMYMHIFVYRYTYILAGIRLDDIKTAPYLLLLHKQ